MRWLLTVLLVSVGTLIIASAGVAWHIWRQHGKLRGTAPDGDKRNTLILEESEIETEEAQ
jgi:hypothetical protein